MMRLLGDSVFGSGKTPIYNLLWRRRVMAGWLSYQAPLLEHARGLPRQPHYLTNLRRAR